MAENPHLRREAETLLNLRPGVYLQGINGFASFTAPFLAIGLALVATLCLGGISLGFAVDTNNVVRGVSTLEPPAVGTPAITPTVAAPLSECVPFTGSRPVHWSKTGIHGASHKRSLPEAFDALNYVLEVVFKDLFGYTWIEMQTQSISGIPVIPTTISLAPLDQENLMVMVSQNTVRSADQWVAVDAPLPNGCSHKDSTSVADAVHVCLELWNNSALTEHTYGSCRATQGSFGIGPNDIVNAFHIKERFFIDVDDSTGTLNQEWRSSAQFNTAVKNRCQAEIAKKTWISDPWQALGLTNGDFVPDFYVYGTTANKLDQNGFKGCYGAPAASANVRTSMYSPHVKMHNFGGTS